MENHTEQNQTPTIQIKNQDKKLRMEQAIKRKKVKQLVWGVVVLIVGVLVIGGSVWYSRWRVKNLLGESYTEVGREHIPLGQEVPKPYNSNPPSSGAHFPSPANWGVYDFEVPDQLFIHNLEHGGVWFSYKPGVSNDVVEGMKAIVEEFGGSKIVMAPRSANDADIAIAAWTRVLKLNLTGGVLTDEQKNEIRSFYKSFKNHGPEFVPDTMPGVDPKELVK